MAGPTSSTDPVGCLALAQRQVGDVAGWTPEQWQAQLAEDSVQRGDPVATHYRPYRTALAYLLRPTVTNRAEGDVSEAYSVSLLQNQAENLRSLDAEWAGQRLPAEGPASADTFDSTIDWGAW